MRWKKNTQNMRPHKITQTGRKKEKEREGEKEIVTDRVIIAS